jgi:NADPH-dependent 2,4-dienoyl-CoA reductase/sulfur reductase-like enzyme/rhodanese-related sulfurtransferase/two-component sensor histidine kinase
MIQNNKNSFEIINKEDFSVLAHQLKSPITAIQSILKTISDGFTGETNLQTLQFIEKALKKTNEIGILISDLLSYQVYSVGGKIEKKDFNLNELLEKVINSFYSEASEKNISLKFNIPEAESIIINADYRGIEIAIRNLIENAFKYTPPNGNIFIKLILNKRKKTCKTEITDSGAGISEKDIKNIFLPFYRSLKFKTSTGGSGLGLSIVNKIIKAHKGNISVSSKEGKGTTFRINLPYKKIVTNQKKNIRKKRIVIIGGVTAGPKAAARLRRLNEQYEIIIIEKSEFLSYSGCGLPFYISGKVRSPKSLMSTADNTIRDINFFESIKNIKIFNKTEAIKIDRKNKIVFIKDLTTNKIRELKYDFLILATGSLANLPPIPGISNKGIFSLHKIEDAEAIKSHCLIKKAQDVFIIGGGLIGIETSESLIETGARVTIFEKKPYILSTLFDNDMSEKVKLALTKKGIKVYTKINIYSIKQQNERLCFKTNRGEYFADFAVLSAGVKPNSELAKKAGLKLSSNGAIIVDERLITSDKSIFAVGDCAESYNFITKKHEYWPLGSISTKMGRIAADNIAGLNSKFVGFIGTAMFQIFDISFARTGLTMESAKRNGFLPVSIVVCGLDKAHYSKDSKYVIIKVIADKTTKKILGAQSYGSKEAVRQIQIVASAILSSQTLCDVFNFDLGYAPLFNNPIEIVQTACCMLMAKIDGLVKTTTLLEFLKDKDSFHIIDVSPFSEHIFNSIPQSINVPLENLRKEGIPFGKNEKCILYSKTSSRAYEAYRYLYANGYQNISILEGGYIYWSDPI